jgi:uncharacterized protein DUF6929
MNLFTLDTFFEISGIGAASGIVYHENQLYLISDNSNFLYVFDITTKHCDKIPLVENPSDAIPKPLKPDFESLALHDGKLYAFGSGSTANRNVLITYDLYTKAIIRKDLSKIYERLRLSANIPASGFNIEGAAFHNNKLLLFQRGNGSGNQNGIFILDDKMDLSREFISIKLPEMGGVEASFTDAVITDNSIYFLAAAEDSQSTYLDGEILGSLFGRINLDDFSIGQIFLISRKHKFEGLSFWKQTENEIIFFLCEDPDSETIQPQIYKLTILRTEN